VKMKHLAFGKGFRIVIDSDLSQAAQMTIAPGGCEGGPGNRHRGADQWLFVVSGRGEATIEGKNVSLSAGSLVLIERAEAHEIRNTGRTDLKTLNLYVPPAYSEDGEELAGGRS